MSTKVKIATVANVLLMLFSSVAGIPSYVSSQSDCLFFPETRHNVCDRFLDYWQRNGGLTQQGYPVTEVIRERSETDGRTYEMQYFERAVFELHPENQPPFDVLLSLVGAFEYKRRYGNDGAPNQHPNAENRQLFTETGKTLGGRFRAYWEQNGALAQQGLPISDEFEERNELNGQTYTVQYFERAVFELHPENQPPFDVLLSQLGTFQLKRKLATCDQHTRLTGYKIAEAVESHPRYELRGYRVEETTLPTALTCSVRVPRGEVMVTETRTFDKFWRVVISGERLYYPTALPWYIWFDDTLVGTSNAGKELIALVYDKTLLKEGATVGVSYGFPTPDATFSQKLHLTPAP
jgi:hypothetical protein